MKNLVLISLFDAFIKYPSVGLFSLKVLLISIAEISKQPLTEKRIVVIVIFVFVRIHFRKRNALWTHR